MIRASIRWTAFRNARSSLGGRRYRMNRPANRRHHSVRRQNAQFVIMPGAPAEFTSIVANEDSPSMEIAVSRTSSRSHSLGCQNILLASELTGVELNDHDLIWQARLRARRSPGVRETFMKQLLCRRDVASIWCKKGIFRPSKEHRLWAGQRIERHRGSRL